MARDLLGLAPEDRRLVALGLAGQLLKEHLLLLQRAQRAPYRDVAGLAMGMHEAAQGIAVAGMAAKARRLGSLDAPQHALAIGAGEGGGFAQFGKVLHG